MICRYRLKRFDFHWIPLDVNVNQSETITGTLLFYSTPLSVLSEYKQHS